MVKCIVKVGTLQFEGGTYQQFQEFEVTAERAAQFDQHDIKIVNSEPAKVEAKPLPQTVIKPTVVETAAKPAETAEPAATPNWGTSKKKTPAKEAEV